MKVHSWLNTRIYKVVHTLEVKENHNLFVNELKYDMGISCADKENSLRRVFIRENYKVNEGENQHHHVRFLCELENSLYPIEIEVTESGTFSRISAHPLWFSEWKSRAHKVLSAYEGEFVKNLFEEISEQVDTEAHLRQKLQKEAFWRTYFFNSQQEQNKEEILSWEVLKIGMLEYKGNLESFEEENGEAGSLFTGSLSSVSKELEEKINKKLYNKKYTEEYIPQEQIYGKATLETRWDPPTGKLHKKIAEVELQTQDQKYTYKERLEISTHAISLRKLSNNNKMSFFISEDIVCNRIKKNY